MPSFIEPFNNTKFKEGLTNNNTSKSNNNNNSTAPETPPPSTPPPQPTSTTNTNKGGLTPKIGSASSDTPNNNNKTGAFSTQPATVYFFVITTFYVVIAYILSGNPDPVKDQKNQAIYFGTYLLLLIAGEYYQNITLTTQYCYSAQLKTAAMMTFVPWVTIFGVLMLMIKIFEGWLGPFANTFGYGFAKLAGLNSLMQDKILKPTQDIDDEDLKQSLAEILTDPSILFNQIPSDTLTFNSFWSKMGPLLRSNVTDESKLKLRHLVTLKYSVAWYIWYLLGGMLTIAVSINWLMSTGCDQNVKAMMKRHEDYQKCIAGDTAYCPSEETAKLLDKKPTKVYATYNQS